MKNFISENSGKEDQENKKLRDAGIFESKIKIKGEIP